MNNVGSKTLFSPIFINPEKVDHFLLCSLEVRKTSKRQKRVKPGNIVTGPQTSCYKSVHKFSSSCIRTACSYVVPTSLEQAVNNCNQLYGIRLVARLFQQV